MDTIKPVAERRVIEISADFNAYTDGSTYGTYGREGVVVTRRNPTSFDVVKTIWRGGAPFAPMKKKKAL